MDQLIAQKAGGIESLRIAWETAFRYSGDSLKDDESLFFLANRIANPSSLMALADSISQDDPSLATESPREQLLSYSNESDYDPTQWIEAMDVLLTRLQQLSRSSSYSRLLGYIACAAEYGSQNHMPHSLKELVSRMIDRYGIESS